MLTYRTGMGWRPTRTSGRCWEAHPEVREGLGGPPGVSGGVVRPTRRSGRGQDAHLEVREGLEGPP